MAAAAQFYHQAAAASAAADPLNSCSQPGAAATQPLPDIPRYPWMSITGKDSAKAATETKTASRKLFPVCRANTKVSFSTDWMSPFDRVVCGKWSSRVLKLL